MHLQLFGNLLQTTSRSDTIEDIALSREQNIKFVYVMLREMFSLEFRSQIDK